MAQAGTQWNAVDYANNAVAQYVWAQSLISQLDLAGNESVLDIGCGDGRVTTDIANLVTGAVMGIDSSAQMVALASERYGRLNRRLAFKQMDATRLVFNAEFELVFSNAVLHWVQDHRAVLAGIQASLKTGGRAVLSMGGKGNAPDILPMLDRLIEQTPWCGYFDGFVFPYAFYGIEEYTHWLAEAGLQARRIELVPKDMVHDGVEDLKAWIRTTWFPYTNRVSQSQREQFIDELVAMYIEQYPVDDDGRTHVRMRRLEVEAVKI